MNYYPPSDIIHAFTNLLADYGIATSDPITLNKFTRFHVEGDKKGSKNGFYILHSDGLPAAHFGCHNRNISENWCIKDKNELTDIERADFNQRITKAREQREKLDLEQYQAAKLQIQKRLINATPPAPDNSHPYLIAKNVNPYGVLIEGENLLIPARDVNGEKWTVQTITPTGDKKFQSGGKKKGCFHLIGKEIEGNGFNQTIVLCEGYATGATDFEALNEKYPVAVCFDSGNLEPVALALREKYPRLKILIAGDNDAFKESNAGKDKAKQTCYSLIGGAAYVIPDFLNVTPVEIQAAMLASQGSGVDWGSAKSEKRKQQIERLKRERLTEYEQRKPTDFNDMAQWLGVARVKQQLENAVESISLITVEGGKLPQIIKQIENEMLFYDGGLYQRTASLVRVIRTEKDIDDKGVSVPAGTLTIHAVNESWLTEYFTKVAKWRKYDDRLRCYKHIDAESKYTNIYLSKVGDWNLPPLKSIVECPTLRRDGSLIIKSGYDKKSGVYVDYQGEPVNVLNNPTKQDAFDALEILKQPLKDFPFVTENDRAVVLAALLTSVVRHSIPTAPLFAVDAPVKGSGKTLIADSIAITATGRKSVVISQGHDESEDEKRIGALLMQGITAFNLDNVERPVNGDFINSLMTSESISTRVLGQSKMVHLKTNATILATGNNLAFIGDMTRRVLIARIDPQCERPDARKFDVDLSEWLPANRHKLIGAVLTLLRAYLNAGKPKAENFTPYGSFEAWNDLIRGSLLWLGVDDPLETRQRLESSDTVKSELGAVLALWHSAFFERGMTAAEISIECEKPNHADLKQALMDVAINKRNDGIDARRLGQWLKRHLERVESGLRFERAGSDTHSKIVYWKVKKVAGIAGIAGIDSNPRVKNVLPIVMTNNEKQCETIPAIPANPAKKIDDDDVEEF